MKKTFLKLNKLIQKKFKQKGFTLAELIVVIAIIAIISTLSIYNSSKLNSAVLLSNTAYEMSLIIRDAQVSGLGSRVMSVEEGGERVATTSNQGVYFNIDEPEKIVFFADKNKNNQYNDGEENQVYNIENKRAGKILGIYKLDGSDEKTQIPDLNIIFKRPNPESYFYFKKLSANYEEHVGSVFINIGFDKNECKTLLIYKTGGIQIDKNYCNI